MNRRLLLAIILSGAAWPALAASSRPAASPLEIVRKIYAVSAGKDGKYQGVTSFADETIRRLYFSKSLVAALSRGEQRARKRDEPFIDFDPVLNTQEEPDVKSLSIAVERVTVARSIVAATFVDHDEKSVVRYEFVKEGGLWKIDDMRGQRGDDKWSLRSIIEGS